MTKEQEVIKYIETRIKICNENADICDDNDFDEEATYLREESYMLETVLNMLKEKDKEIEHQKEKRNNQKEELAILNEKQKEMNKLINNVKSYKGQIKKLEHINKSYKGIINKKDKEIEELKQALVRNIAKNFTSSIKESAKSKEDLEMLNKGWQIELEKKNTQIDLMAERIEWLCKGNGILLDKEHDGNFTQEDIKQYFERKSEEWKKI